MKELYDEAGGNVIAVEHCDPGQTQNTVSSAGASPSTAASRHLMVEKPAPADAPSNFYISGRYILQPEIFDLLERQERGAGGEIQLTDAMVRLAETQPFNAHPYDGRTFDCGSKQGFIEATVAFALARDDIRDSVLGPLRQLLDSHGGDREAA